MAWPPTLEDLRSDIRGRVLAGEQLSADTSDTAALQLRLDAAVGFVSRIRRGDFNFGDNPALPAPDADTVLGTLMLAARWQWRRRSPDALIDAGDLGSSRVPSFDPDIERLLRIGRHQKPRVG